jgi:hypothetical protein
MFLSSLMAIAAVLIMGVISPGPSFIYVARNAVARSRMHGLVTALGTGAGGYLFDYGHDGAAKSADGGAGNVYWPEGRGRPLSALAGV